MTEKAQLRPLDVGHMFDGKTGDDYIRAVRRMARMMHDRGSRMFCGICQRANATHIGMQRCGEPGGPVCMNCLRDHQQWMDTASTVAEGTRCRHCGEDVDRSHIYAVSLLNDQAAEIAL